VPSAYDAHTWRRRDAVRLLHILNEAGEPARGNATDMPAAAVKAIKSEKKIQALDFWVRNPDYLAHELLDQYERDGDPELLRQAAAVMAGNEPDVRRLGMLRFFFGAFERIDDAIATLKTHGLADVRVRLRGNRPVQREYYLLREGNAKATDLGPDDVLKWYSERAALVAKVAGGRSGDALKNAQYAVEQYEGTRWGEIIEPITSKVRERLTRLRARAS
jgi:hypothetical protein